MRVTFLGHACHLVEIDGQRILTDPWLVDPIFEYGRDQGISVTGGYVATASDVPAITGKYVFGDFGSGQIWALALPETRKDAEATLLGKWDVQISTFGRDAQGRVYVGDFASGTIYRIASP